MSLRRKGAELCRLRNSSVVDVPKGSAPYCRPSEWVVRVRRVTPALASLSPVILDHRNIGASTGYMADHYGDWPKLVEGAISVATVAAELSALSEPELPSLADYLEHRPPLPFLYLSVHAPTKALDRPEQDVVAELATIAPMVDAIVFHPDCLGDLALYEQLGPKLVLENMDVRKDDGRTAEELTRYFAALPDAGLCFDIAHAHSIDVSLDAANGILDEHGHRLRHVHLSSLDEACHHQTLTSEDELHFASLLDRCRDVPWILEAPPALTE